MPELPEVEVTTRAVDALITGLTLKKIIVRKKQLRWQVPAILEKLTNLKIKLIKRRAKYILLNTSKGTVMIHLGMSGHLAILENNETAKKHDHVDFIFNNQRILRYNDPRRFGSIHFIQGDPNLYHLLSHLGPEPLSKKFSPSYLYKITRNKKAKIKNFIMDQKVVVGIGNIYANEALFRARILPTRSAHDLTMSECKLLVHSIRQVLKEAIKKGGTTLQNFLSPHGTLGYFSQNLLVYGRENKLCYRCKKNIIETAKINQRSTFYCSKCQK